MTRYRKSWTQVIEEVILNEALKKIDKDVIDAFYYRKEKEGKVVSTDGDTLTKLGMGGQQIAKWVGRKVKITAVSDVKSTESILKYMKKSIPSGLFEEEVEATRMPMEAPFVLTDGVTGPTRMEIQKFFDKEKGTLRARLNKTSSHFNIRDVVVNSKGTVVGYQMEEVEEGKSYLKGKAATGYDLYHKDFSSAMQHAYKHAKSKGFTVDPKEIDDKVATGPKKPSSGKTNRYILGTDKKKKVHIQVANLDNKRYELNMYFEGTTYLKVDLKKLKKEYDKNEDQNKHTENYLLLAKTFGSPAEVKKVQDIMKRNAKQGHTSKSDNDWMYKNI
ncbi:uncharacterized protein METZ01_LOCUS322762, partial [marine metagenome]